jgi:hypothetical protein
MIVIPPLNTDLAYTGTSPVYVLAAWADATYYAKNTTRRYEVSSVWYDYICRVSHTSNTTWKTPTSTYYWTKTGISATSGGYTYTTNVRHSNSAAWVSGAAVTQFSVVYDEASHRDYQATVAISTGDNTIRPSAAVLSTTEAVAARWVDMGGGNAFAPFDTEISSKLLGYDNDGDIVNPAFTFTATTGPAAADHLFFAGLVNVKTISAAISVNGVLQQTVTADLSANSKWDIMQSSAILPFTSVVAGKTLSIAVTLTRNTSTIVPECGTCGVGLAYELAHTEWGVETSILIFSRQERNETYGTVKFLKRGSARTARAICFIDTASISGDHVQMLLQRLSGQPLMMDFNNTGSSYDRLRIFGFFTNVRSGIQASSYESLAMDVEGLVE